LIRIGVHPDISPGAKGDSMGRIVVTEFVSLDGVMEDPGGAEGFQHGGWAFLFNRGDDSERFKLDETLQSDAMLLGRRTYEEFAKAWPAREGEFADKFNSMPKYVYSATLTDPQWANTTRVDGDLGDIVEELRREHEGDVVVHGSAQLARTLVEHDLVDELRLMMFPVLLGDGKRLFGTTDDKTLLRLVSSRVVGDGVVILIYAPASR
jgi:dihydrofolate reductase